MEKTIETLKEWDELVGHHEKAFVARFCPRDVELLDVWWNSERMKFNYLFECGQHVTDGASMEEWVDFLKSCSENGQKPNHSESMEKVPCPDENTSREDVMFQLNRMIHKGEDSLEHDGYTPDSLWLEEIRHIIQDQDGTISEFRKGFVLDSKRIRELEKERAELQEWKDEMLSVMPPMQEIGHALDMTLGTPIHSEILPKILELKKQRDVLREGLLKIDEIYVEGDKYDDTFYDWDRMGKLARETLYEHDKIRSN